MPAPKAEPLVFTYRFKFPDKSAARMDVTLDADTLLVQASDPNPAPEWCKLEYRQCPNCPLNAKENPLCPVAAKLHGVVDRFKDCVSFSKVEVHISAGQRTLRKTASVADALTSLMGIYMAGGGCPILDRLRPMLLTHMPFASGIETFYRSLSTYLLGQHFVAEAGGTPDWTFGKLHEASDAIQDVNQAFCKRLQGLGIADGVLNAISHLDCFAMLVGRQLRDRQLDKIRKLFGAYMGPSGAEKK
ncbi:MAG: hypothetical protein HY553_13835 [Elusimicrobia bacterium]|nr:hypothetical protein [Elusimicrobiota bacterium]